MTDTTPHLPTKIQQELQKTITDIQMKASQQVQDLSRLAVVI